jgi:hypothetical protein
MPGRPSSPSSASPCNAAIKRIDVVPRPPPHKKIAIIKKSAKPKAANGGATPMNEIHVLCYSGYRPNERPQKFTVKGREFEVSELDGQWYSPDAIYFRVRANDGNYYVLRHDEGQDSWTLDAFRANRQ